MQKENLSGTQQEKSVPAAIRKPLDRVEQRRLLLHFIEDDEARAVIQPADRIRCEPEALVGIVEGQIHRGPIRRCRQQITDQGRLTGLTGAGEDGDGSA